MKRKDNIMHEVEKTLQSIDGIKRAKTDELFYTRLQSRMEIGKSQESSWTWYSLAAAIIILLLVNVFTIREYQESYGNGSTETVRQENLDAFAEEYQNQVDVPTIYELNTNTQQ
ncbi:MAG TPA: hypothetical protein VJ964_05210 [Balneolaceae bacterium]|nr:hypothetical protein [Balneolaceae bacterium]